MVLERFLILLFFSLILLKAAVGGGRRLESAGRIHINSMILPGNHNREQANENSELHDRQACLTKQFDYDVISDSPVG